MSVNISPIYLKDMTDLQSKRDQWEPYAWFHKMRNESPVFYDANQDVWNVFRYQDVKRVLSNYELFTSKRTRSFFPVAHTTENRSTVNFSDPPVHTHRRGFLSKAFSAKNISNWESRIKKVIDEIMTPIRDQDQFDMVEDFAIPLPIIVMAELLGVPSRDRELFKRWSTTMFLPHDKEKQSEIMQQKQQCLKEFAQYMIPIVQEKRKNPTNDIISDLIVTECDGEHLNDQEVLSSSMALLGGGFEQTTNLIANSFYCFLIDQKGIYPKLREEPNLIPLAMEEVLRYRFPVCLDRQVAQDTNVFGHEMKKGQMVVAWVSAANRDEQEFPHAEEFDIHRTENKKHLSFGAGAHFCPGSALARLKVRVALTTVIEHFADIRLPDSFCLEDHLIESVLGQSLKSLPVIVQMD
ncbi:cytochrome P450 [Marininema halotolerans]|uniref:Cytochrome P450 n=1 Tax=Marininema halotolerans TaxID=1155944 RepID=A0A1I6PR47_9BACL|nr:cytochrome P450 [Marininema halotolerans]SFS42590.1 hypothetical protein SAMN05444972_10274 [Marininema halotolerans]